MKVLFKKLKQTNKVFLVIYLITLVAYFTSYVMLVKNLVSLAGIETLIRFIIIFIFGFWLIGYFLWNLVNLIQKKYIAIIIISFITLIVTVVFFIINYYLGFINHSINNLSESKYVTYTTNLITMNDTIINEKSVLGMINSSDDIEGNMLAKELIKHENLDNLKVESYASYYEMINDLLNNNIDGIFLTSNYMSIFGGEDAFEDLKKTKIAYSYSEKLENQDKAIVSNKSLKEPFTILLMGVDSSNSGIDANASFNGDTLMLITFNPKTLNATMFSIPRDTYVPIACNNNNYAKINSSAAYGTSCVINTIKALTDIEIDYYVKVNFKAVVDLVEAIGGIDVDVEAPDYDLYYQANNGQICEQNSLRQFGENIICFDPGMQHLNGEEALAYARCRHAYLQSDIARNRHQQAIIEAIAKKLINPSIINKFENILNSITDNLATNMATKQILSLYDVLKSIVSNSLNDGDFISISKTYLQVYDLNVRTSQNGYFTSALGYHPESLNAIVHLMKENLELEETQMIKTFSFDANETYKTKLTGEGVYGGEILETVPSFIGKSVSEVESWASSRNIEIKTQFVDNTSAYYNENIAPGLVANQSVNYGVLLKNISNITIYINSSSPVISSEENQDNENTENEEEIIEDKDNTNVEEEIDLEEDNIENEGLEDILPIEEIDE